MAFEKLDVNYAAEYSQELANVMPYQMYFSALTNNENSTKYRPLRGKTVEIPSITVSGATAVNRDQITGVFNRNWNNSWQAVTLGMDREWSTFIDPKDIDETNMTVTVANVTRAFLEQQKFPEMDSRIASRLAAAAIANSNADTTTLTAANILEKWDTAIATLTKKRFNRDRCVAFLTSATYKLLKEAAGITRFIDTGTGIRSVDRNIAKLDGVVIVEVPDDVMMTAYDYDEGWEAASGAGQINWLIVALDAVSVPVVYETAMVSAPSAQNKGKYLYYERYYYDCFVLANRTGGVLMNYTANPS